MGSYVRCGLFELSALTLREMFYDELVAVVYRNKGHNILVRADDFNALLGNFVYQKLLSDIRFPGEFRQTPNQIAPTQRLRQANGKTPRCWFLSAEKTP